MSRQVPACSPATNLCKGGFSNVSVWKVRGWEGYIFDLSAMRIYFLHKSGHLGIVLMLFAFWHPF